MICSIEWFYDGLDGYGEYCLSEKEAQEWIKVLNESNDSITYYIGYAPP